MSQETITRTFITLSLLAVALSGSAARAQYTVENTQHSSASAKLRQNLPGARMTAEQRRALAQYGPAISVAFGQYEVPSSIIGRLSARVHPGDPVAEAQSALQTHGVAFRLRPDDAFTPDGVETDKAGAQHVRMRQTYKHLAVIGGELTVHLDQSYVTGISGRFVPDLDLSDQTSTPDALQSAAGSEEPVIVVDQIGTARVVAPAELSSAASSRGVASQSFAPALTAACAPLTICPSTNLIRNSGFESGNNGDWTVYSSTGNTTDVIGNFGTSCYAGAWCTWLNGWGTANTERIYQAVTIPANTSTASLSLYLRINTSEGNQYPYDTLKVQIWSAKPTTTYGPPYVPGVLLSTLKTYSNVDAWSLPFSYGNNIRQAFDVTRFKGQTVIVYFEGHEDSSLQTSFWIDSVVLSQS